MIKSCLKLTLIQIYYVFQFIILLVLFGLFNELQLCKFTRNLRIFKSLLHVVLLDTYFCFYL